MENKAARTASGPIFQVALEQLVPEQQRLVHDRVAYQFLPGYLKAVVNLCHMGFVRHALFSLINLGGPGIQGGILCRKRYISDVLKAALNRGIQTFVVLGCGFDTLVYRESGLSSRQVYEVDLLQVIQAKEVLLHRTFGQVPAHVKLVSMDFEAESIGLVLQQAGYSSGMPTLFIWEGVTQYISEEAVRRIFEFFKQASPGSQLLFTFIRKDFIDGKQMYGQRFLFRQTRMVKQLWQFGLELSEIGAFLDQYFWKELDQAGSAEYQQRYLKPLKRSLSVMEVERVVHAERITD